MHQVIAGGSLCRAPSPTFGLQTCRSEMGQLSPARVARPGQRCPAQALLLEYLKSTDLSSVVLSVAPAPVAR